jgi:23S rRNA pseudouridine1911/1915/1917 synthase
MAKNSAAFEKMVPIFQQHLVTKVYHGIVAGQVEPRTITVTTPIDGLPAVSRLRVVSANRYASHLEILIETGRTHQIRKHMLSIDHPVLGDKNYGTRLPASARTITVARQMLHASEIQFRNPASQRHIHARAPLPADFLACLRTFRLTA